MSKQTRVSHPIYSILPTEVEGFGPLAELALDMRSSWDHHARKRAATNFKLEWAEMEARHRLNFDPYGFWRA